MRAMVTQRQAQEGLALRTQLAEMQGRLALKEAELSNIGLELLEIDGPGEQSAAATVPDEVQGMDLWDEVVDELDKLVEGSASLPSVAPLAPAPAQREVAPEAEAGNDEQAAAALEKDRELAAGSGKAG
jgi:hypothetical protein